MNLEIIKQHLQRIPNLATNIGFELLDCDGADVCMARMKVDERNRQPFGYLSGGSSLAMAETLAGCGSYGLCPEAKACVGQNVQGNHVHPAREGETVIATARLLHQGKATHIWNVEIRNEEGLLVSTITVTNYIIY